MLISGLDGLESESSGRVCVMLTAMDVNHLPPAWCAPAAWSYGSEYACRIARRADLANPRQREDD